MHYAHERYCDENHGPRQRCNDARAPQAPQETVTTVIHARPAHLQPPVKETEPSPELPASDAIRTAVQDAPMHAASPYATIAAERMSAAIEDEYVAADAAPWQIADESGARRPIRMVIVAIVLVVVFLLLTRGRRRSDDPDDE